MELKLLQRKNVIRLIPLSGVRPFSTRVGKLMIDKKEQALAGQKIKLGSPSS